MGVPVPAEKLGERYAIYGEIASGGMASVHFARLLGPVGFSRTVAIKRLHANLREQDEFVRMFLDEARLAARVRHPNVVATIDVVETKDHICLVMEYVHGESLRRLARRAMAQGGRVPRRIVAAIMVGALHGLHAAHEAKNEQGEPLNLVHRDVSPHNIIVGADGIPRVIDFGIAKARGQLPDTTAGAIKGKFAYMAPEQLNAGKVTRAADIYSASIVLWELLTGRRLFDSKMDASLLERATVKVQRPSTIVPSLTPALDGIVARGLSGDPEQRFSSARAMARAIEDCIAPASTADVGEWVERMAKDRLDLREGVLAEIEGRGPQQPPTAPTLVLPLDGSLLGAPSSSPPDKLAAYATNTPSTSAVVPASRITDVDVDGPTSENDAAPTGLAGRSIRPPGPAGPSIRPPPSLEPASTPVSISAAEPEPRRGFRWGRLGAALGVAGCALLAVSIYEAPSYVRSRVADASAEEGLRLAVGEVVFRPHAVLLTENHASPVGLDGVSVEVGDVEIGLDGLSPAGVLVRGFGVTCSGAVGDRLAGVARWATAQTSPLYVDARSGHVVWNDPFGTGTVLEAWDTQVQSSPGKLTIASPSVTVRTARSKLGPWAVKIERAAATSSLSVSFDPASAAPALAFHWGDAQSSVVLDLARAPLSKLGIVAGSLGLLGDVEVAGRSSVIKTPDGKAQGQLALSLFGLGADAAQASVTGRLNGDGMASLVLSDGQVSLGPSRAPLAGTVAVLDSGIRLELTTAGGVRGLPASLVFDTRELGSP